MAENETAVKEETLNKEEFRQLISHLEHNQLFLIEIKSSEKWQNLFDAHYENKILTSITCTACSTKLQLEEFVRHINLNTHIEALKNVEDFYHPLLTSKRKDTATSNDKTTEDSTETKLQKANAIVAKIELLKRSNSLKCESYSSVVTLSPEELMTVEFQKKKGDKWKPLIKNKGDPHANSKYFCMICTGACSGIIPLHAHLKGASHRNLQLKVHDVRVPKREDVTKTCQISFNVGEFSKPKNESNKIKKVFAEKKRVVPFNKGLIGVEYVVQLDSVSQTAPKRYACCLCDTEIMTSAEAMEKHLISSEHRLTYCEKYYLDTIENFKRMITDCRANYKKVMPFVLERMAHGIDQYHGYGTPRNTTEAHFKRAKKKLNEELEGLPHACQEFGPSFSNVVTIQELRDFNKAPVPKVEDDASINAPVRFANRDPRKYYLNFKVHVSRPAQKRLEKPVESRKSRASSLRRDKSYDKRSRSSSEDLVPRKRMSISGQRDSYGTTDIWSVYRNQISKAAIELESLYVGYRKKPEKHPLYDHEWNTFWRRRKEELILEGKNYRAYNFQPEWTTYFRQRLEQMFGEDLQKSKINIRSRLNIPIDAEEDTFPASQHQPISVDNLGIEKHFSTNTWDKTFIPHRAEERLKSVQAPEKVKPTVIHMLRLMTALEDHLGNLGTKILELLTKAVTLEKFYASDSLELEKEILTTSNYKLLKIATEKLKSKLYAGLVEGNSVNSFKRVIESSEFILKKAENMGWANENELTVDTESTQIKQLIEVLQDKKAASPSTKKSLSDALMEVISSKKLKGTQNSFESSMPTKKQNSQHTNNVPRHDSAYSGMPTVNTTNFPPNRNGQIYINPAYGRGNGMQFNNQYARNSFGNTNMPWPSSNTQFNVPSYNQGPHSSFMGSHSNFPNNNGTWRS